MIGSNGTFHRDFSPFVAGSEVNHLYCLCGREENDAVNPPQVKIFEWLDAKCPKRRVEEDKPN